MAPASQPRGHPAAGLGARHPPPPPPRTPLSAHPRGAACFELRLVVLRCHGEGRDRAAPAAGTISEPSCSRLGGLDSSSPVRSISSPGSSRHRRCQVPADVSRAARGRGAGPWSCRRGAGFGSRCPWSCSTLPVACRGCSVCGCSVCISPGPASVSPSDQQDPISRLSREAARD